MVGAGLSARGELRPLWLLGYLNPRSCRIALTLPVGIHRAEDAPDGRSVLLRGHPRVELLGCRCKLLVDRREGVEVVPHGLPHLRRCDEVHLRHPVVEPLEGVAEVRPGPQRPCTEVLGELTTAAISAPLIRFLPLLTRTIRGTARST